MDAPDELRRVLADAKAAADANQEFTYPELADAVLSVPGIADALADVEVYRTALGLACSDGWSDGASAMQSYIETARDHIVARAALYPEAGK